MATITITRTISAAHLNRAVAALRAKYGMPAEATAQDVQAEWERRTFREFIGIVNDYERVVAANSAAGAVTEIVLT